MNDQALHPSADVTAADWLRPRLRRFGSAVSAVVPDRFPAYVRILHPARGPKGQPVRWAEVAAWSGRSMHRLAQFHAISRPSSAARANPTPWDGEDPPEGNLPAELLRILCAALARHTSTPESCWLCLWDGHGWLHGSPSVAIMSNHGSIPVPSAFPAEVLEGPRVRLPGRDYLLFAGPLAAAPIRALTHGRSNQTTPSPSTATRSTPRQQLRGQARTVASLQPCCCHPLRPPPFVRQPFLPTRVRPQTSAPVFANSGRMDMSSMRSAAGRRPAFAARGRR